METTQNEFQQTEETTIFSIKKFKQQAKAQLKNRRLIPTLALIFSTIVSLLIYVPYYYILFKQMDDQASVPADAILKMYALLFPLMILIFVIISTLQIANISLYFKMFKSSEKITFSDFINGFSLWLKGLAANLLRSVFIYLWALLAMLPCVGLISVGTIITVTTNSNVLLVLTPMILLVCYVLLFSVLLVKLYQYSQMIYMIVDNPKISAKKALNLSIKITKGYKKNLFVLDLSFIGWNLLSILTLGIATLWVFPYQILTQINAYDFLKKEYVKKVKSELNLPTETETEPTYTESKETNTESESTEN